MKISKFCKAHSTNLPLVNYRVHSDNFSKKHSKLFYEEYKLWFDKNYVQKENKNFKRNLKFFKNKLSYLEISNLLINENKSFMLFKKILNHKNIIEKLKFFILYLIPKKFYKFFKQ